MPSQKQFFAAISVLESSGLQSDGNLKIMSSDLALEAVITFIKCVFCEIGTMIPHKINEFVADC